MEGKASQIDATLPELEEQIKTCLTRIKKDSLTAGKLLKQIKEGGLYLESGCANWAEYVDRRLDIGLKYADALIREVAIQSSLARQLADKPTIPKPNNSAQLQELAPLPVDERARVWTEAVKKNDGKPPKVKDLREEVKQAKKQATKAKTAGEILKPEDWAKLRSPELTREEKWAFVRTAGFLGTIADMDAEEVAEAAIGIQQRPTDITREIEKCERIISWIGRYQQTLMEHQRKGIHAVK